MSAPRQPIAENQLQGFKYFRKILPLLNRLHQAGTQRDRAGNRLLHFDQYIALQLLFFFNPVVTSMRGLVQASHLRKVQQVLGIHPTSLSSFSEAPSVFDPELLKPIIAHGGRDVTLHTHFELLRGVPPEMDLTTADACEIDHLLAHLQAGRIYVKDRGYACFRLFQAIVDIHSHFVCRVRDDSVYRVVEDRPVSPQAWAAGVLSDRIVWLGRLDTGKALRQPVRLLQLACRPHRKRHHGGYGGPEQGAFLPIATSLLDVPAEVISLLYRKRWTVELFFRFFKHVLGCRHLLSHRADGIQIQTYLAIVVCMLLALWTGRKPSLRTIEMIQFI